MATYPEVHIAMIRQKLVGPRLVLVVQSIQIELAFLAMQNKNVSLIKQRIQPELLI